MDKTITEELEITFERMRKNLGDDAMCILIGMLEEALDYAIVEKHMGELNAVSITLNDEFTTKFTKDYELIKERVTTLC